MDFDQLMARYDNMVRQLAFYQAENKTLESKLAREKERADKLEKELMDCRSKPGNMAPHYALAKEVYSLNPMMLKIEMIKEVRHRAGWGLAEAKEAVEKVLAEDKSTPVGRLLSESQPATTLIPFDPNRALKFARKWHKEHPDFSREVFVAFVEMHNYCSIEDANWVVDQVLEEYKAAGEQLNGESNQENEVNLVYAAGKLYQQHPNCSKRVLSNLIALETKCTIEKAEWAADKVMWNEYE